MTEFLDWMSDGMVWIEDQIYDMYETTDSMFQSLNQLITDFDSFISIATGYLYISGIALFILFIMLINVISYCKRLEQKINFLMRDDMELYDKDKELYRFYK